MGRGREGEWGGERGRWVVVGFELGLVISNYPLKTFMHFYS